MYSPSSHKVKLFGPAHSCRVTSVLRVPAAGNDCETFWDTDSLMDNCYQFNFHATLSWSEARVSCQQQGADLLSITKVEEQTYINGEREKERERERVGE